MKLPVPVVHDLDGPLVRWGWLLAAGLVLQGIAALVVVRDLWDPLRASLIAASYAVLVVGVGLNLRYRGFRLLLVGLVLNALVIGANGWRMPVDPQALERTGYHAQAAQASGTPMRTPKQAIVERTDMALWPLADVIAVPPVRRVISIGDVFAYTGVVVAIAELLRRSLRAQSTRPSHSTPPTPSDAGARSGGPSRG